MRIAGSSKHERPEMALQRSARTKLIVASVVAVVVVAVAFALALTLLLSADDSGSAAQNTAEKVAAAALSVAEAAWRPDTETSASVVAATAVGIIDGDSIVFRLASGKEEEVRLIGLDAPEMKLQRDVYGMASAKYATQQLRTHPGVYLEKGPDRRDAYGRLLAYVWFVKPAQNPSSADVRANMLNAQMLIEGYATLYTKKPNTKYATLFKAYASQARADNRGFWDSKLVDKAGVSASWTASLTTSAKTVPAPYTGNLTSKFFHVTSCENAQKMRRSNRVPFVTREDAIDAGYKPCGLCNP
jgi:micrococcal nuclease